MGIDAGDRRDIGRGSAGRRSDFADDLSRIGCMSWLTTAACEIPQSSTRIVSEALCSLAGKAGVACPDAGQCGGIGPGALLVVTALGTRADARMGIELLPARDPRRSDRRQHRRVALLGVRGIFRRAC